MTQRTTALIAVAVAVAVVVSVDLLYDADDEITHFAIGGHPAWAYIDNGLIVIETTHHRSPWMSKELKRLPEVSGVAPRSPYRIAVAVNGPPQTILPILVTKMSQIHTAARPGSAAPAAGQTRSPAP